MLKRIAIIIRYIKSVIISKLMLRSNNIVTIIGKVYINSSNIKFGRNVTLHPGVQIWGNGKIILGDNVAIGKDTIIFAANQVIIGNDTLIAAQSYIIDCDHGMEKKQLIRLQLLDSKPINIGNDVWIGAGAKILKGSRIHDGAVIGALTLVNGEIEEYSINVGIPSKKIGMRK